MAAALINVDMLAWARERARLSRDEIAHKLNVDCSKVEHWELGELPLTFNQAKKYANITHVPFGYLFLKTPPESQLSVPDLRTVGSKVLRDPSPELRDVIALAKYQQDWYREFAIRDGLPKCRFIGKASVDSKPELIVQQIRKALNIPPHPSRGRWDDYYRDLVKRIESLGVLVMRMPSVGHHSRPLSVDEFRGFALLDEYAPIIFINDADVPGAKLFTLIHELCHLWIGVAGVSDSKPNSANTEEKLCNAVAGELLVPESEFLYLWEQERGTNWKDTISILESHFHVSKWVLARRALTLGSISKDEYGAFIAKLSQETKGRDSSGPNFYRVKASQISKSFAKAVLSEALTGRLLLREASDLLGGVKPSGLSKFAEELGV